MLTRKQREREMYRNDFSDTFLQDYQRRLFNRGHDPRNHIGRNFGFNAPRVLQIFHDRVFGWKR